MRSDLAEIAARYEQKVGLDLSYRDDQGALSSGHEPADCSTCKLAAGFGKVELERRISTKVILISGDRTNASCTIMAD